MLRARRVRAGVWRLVPSQPVHVTLGYGRPNKNAWLTTAHPTRPWDIGSTLSGAFTLPWLRALSRLVETTGPRPAGGPRAACGGRCRLPTRVRFHRGIRPPATKRLRAARCARGRLPAPERHSPRDAGSSKATKVTPRPRGARGPPRARPASCPGGLRPSASGRPARSSRRDAASGFGEDTCSVPCVCACVVCACVSVCMCVRHACTRQARKKHL